MVDLQDIGMLMPHDGYPEAVSTESKARFEPALRLHAPGRGTGHQPSDRGHCPLAAHQEWLSSAIPISSSTGSGARKMP